MKQSIVLTSIIGALFFAQSLAYADEMPPFAAIETYTLGDLNGQDGWSDFWNSLVVEDDVVASSTQALRSRASYGGSAFKEIPKELYEHGGATVKFQVAQNTFSDDQGIIGLFKNNTQETVALLRFTNAFNTYDNVLVASESAAQNPQVLGILTQGEWHTLFLEWRREDMSVRARLDSQPWTEWFSTQTGWSEGDNFGLTLSLPDGNTYGRMYLADVGLYVPLPEPKEDTIIEKIVEKVTDTVSDILDTIVATSTSTILEIFSLPSDEVTSSGAETATTSPESEVAETAIAIGEHGETASTTQASSTEASRTPEAAPIEESAESAPEIPVPEVISAPLETGDSTATTTTF